MSDVGYSRLVSWEVTNFMSIKHGSASFDENNIVFFKGYNDSGKSAMLTALKVLFYNAYANKHHDFITDDEGYFRIVAKFSDGVAILREKYVNGQSLYEMYKDDEVIFSTKNNGVLTKVSGVPEPIETYLGLLSYNDTYVNARACFEKQLGVQTTGSENYNMFNVILKSEEIAVASNLINSDRNKVNSDITYTDAELQSKKELRDTLADVSLGLITELESMDKDIDRFEGKMQELKGVSALRQELNGVVIPPQVDALDTDRLDSLASIDSLIQARDSLVDYPILPNIDNSRLVELTSIQNIFTDLSSTVVPPEVGHIDTTRLDTLSGIRVLMTDLSDCCKDIDVADTMLESVKLELSDLEVELSNHGVSAVRCPNCGELFSIEGVK